MRSCGAVHKRQLARAAPHDSASRFGERFFVKARFETRRHALCISSVSNRSIGGKDPPKRADAIMRRCPYKITPGNRWFPNSGFRVCRPAACRAADRGYISARIAPPPFPSRRAQPSVLLYQILRQCEILFSVQIHMKSSIPDFTVFRAGWRRKKAIYADKSTFCPKDSCFRHGRPGRCAGERISLRI